MKRSLLIAPLLLFLGLIILLGSPARAQNPAVIYLDPAELTLAPGETAGYSVLIEGASDLFGLEIHLAYDPAVVQILDSEANTPGVQLILGDLLDPEEGFLVANAADNASGELDYALTLLAPAAAVSGDGLILAFELQAIAGGTSPLDLTAVLASADGVSLPVTVEGGRVTVAAGQSTGGPTPTSTPVSTTRRQAPTSPTATAATTEGGGAGSPATPNPLAPAEATGPAGLSDNPSTQSEPASGTVAEEGGATIPGDQPESLDPPSNGPAGESSDGSGDSLAVARTPAPIGVGSSSAPSENDSPDVAGAAQVGILLLGSFLLLAAIIFFGRRLLRRYQ